MRSLFGLALALCAGAGSVLAVSPGKDASDHDEADAQYYVLIFAAQGPGNRPRHSHTFATFVRTTADDSDKGYQVESHTISWLPATLNVRPLALFPERGRNLTLEQTMRWARSLNASVTAWGPYPIAKELYDKSLKRLAVLNSGAMSYKAMDTRFRGGNVCNCVHAVSDIDPSLPLLGNGLTYGNAGSSAVVSYFARWLRPADQDLNWVVAELQLAPSEVYFAAGPQVRKAPTTTLTAED